MYGKALSKLYKIYCSPTKIIYEIKKYVLKKHRISEKETANVRIVAKKIKNTRFLLKIQIINSRTFYTVSLSNIISDYYFIKSCEPFSLVQLGYYSKIEEIKRPLTLKTFSKKKFNFLQILICKFKGKTENKINVFDYYYILSDIYINNGQIKVRLSILETSSIFDVPFRDFILDKSLLENTYPLDLLRIGYKLCQLEIQETHKPTFEI